jgi:O-antigen/teichoic acid export membrane protein
MSKTDIGKAKLNAIASYLHFLAASVLTFFVSPFLAHSLGAEHFGIWKACQKYLSFASIADGRSTQALKWVIAKCEGEQGNIGEKHRAVTSALIVSLIFLPLSLLVVAGIAYALPTLINELPREDISLIRLVGFILGLNVLFSPIFGLPDAILVGTNQAYRSTSIHIAWLFVANCTVVCLVYLGFGLVAIASTFAVVALLQAATVFFVCKKKVAWLGLRRPWKSQLKTFIGFSVWVLMWSFVARLLLASEVILIGMLIGSEAVAIFVFSAYIPQLAISVCMMTCSAITPGLGKLLGAGDFVRLREIVILTREVIYCFAVIFGGSVLMLNEAFISLWVGSDYYIGDLPNVLMVVLMVQLVMFRCEGQIQDTTLKIQSKVLWGAFGVTSGLLLGALLHHVWFPGLMSLFMGLFVGRCVISLRFPAMVNASLQIKGVLNRRFYLGLLLLGFCYGASSHIDVSSWWSLFMVSGLLVTALLAVSFIVLLSKEARGLLIARVQFQNS